MQKKDYLTELHKTQVEILDEIDKICKKNNIKYFLIGGTLLGAVRHKGFIPWDDDIDIGMERNDYDKFKRICLDDNVLSSKYFLHSIETDRNYFLPFMKIRKNDTSFVEKMSANITGHKGIFVDIFPFDNIDKIGGFFNKLRAYLVLNISDALKCKRKILRIKDCRKKCAVLFFSIFSIHALQKLCDRLLKWQNNRNTQYICCFVSGSHPFAEHANKAKSFPLNEVFFEKKNYPCFNNYDLYLKSTYGDYMKLPPKEKRVTHMPLFVSFTEGENYRTKRIKK